MNILALNCGSSSLKYRVYEWPGKVEAAGGEAVRIGPPTAEPARIKHHHNGQSTTHEIEMPDHSTAFDAVNDILRKDDFQPDVIGHRMVHGGEEFDSHTIVSEQVMPRLRSVRDLAPLHNPPAMRLLGACRELYPDIPQVVVFDTVFHSTIPEYAYTYALPRKLAENQGIRKYGFHGISHQYVVEQTAQFLEIPHNQFSAVSCHLGSGGASLCAVRNGESVDNTMGFSPLQGLIMSTRCGDLDPAAVLQLLDRYDIDAERVENILNRESGVLGLSGTSSDIRDVLGAARSEEDNGQLDEALHTYLWRIRKYLGSYLTVTAPSDAIIFTDTVGEQVPEVRSAICADLDQCGVSISPTSNRNVDALPVDVAEEHSDVRIIVVSTNEELAIASATARLAG
ncbi:MAG: acetate/propionate family kinase [Planctomycetota bacterium]